MYEGASVAATEAANGQMSLAIECGKRASMGASTWLRSKNLFQGRGRRDVTPEGVNRSFGVVALESLPLCPVRWTDVNLTTREIGGQWKDLPDLTCSEQPWAPGHLIPLRVSHVCQQGSQWWRSFNSETKADCQTSFHIKLGLAWDISSAG